MNYLFYSDKCNYSKELLNLIKKENLNDKINIINIDNDKNKNEFIKLGFNKIPLLITSDTNKPLYGTNAFEWINNQKYFNQITNNYILLDKIKTPDIKNDVDKYSYNKNETSKISNNYTNINNDNIIDNNINLY